jgi:tetratricopeptide (TPR) repeat protein
LVKAATQKPAILAWLLALAILAGGAGGAHADLWYVHYDNALRALANEDWRTAVAELRQAIERKGDSGVRVRTYGMRVVDYFPYLKLGIAYHHLGEEAAALAAFDTEERLGVVAGSPAAKRELEAARQAATLARSRPAAPPRRDPETILTQSLAEARRLAAAGKTREAMNALAPGLAVDPTRRELTDLMASLGAKAVAAEENQRQVTAARGSLDRARAHLAAGEAEEAAGLLRPLVAAGPNEEAERLLAKAQAAILAAGTAGPAGTAERRSGQIATALEEARRLQAAGQVPAALGRLETVLALDPGNAEARKVREALLLTQKNDRESAFVAEILRSARAHFLGGRDGEALAAANRVLALDRRNPEALGMVRQAYARISQRLLGPAGSAGSARGTGLAAIPPALRFSDLRQEVDGERVEVAERADFRLSGVAIARSPVTIAVFGPGGRKVASSSSVQAVGDLYLTEFAVRHHLAPGASTLTVVATDRAGLRSEGRYAVLYHRPWRLSPWPWVMAAAMTGALGLVAAGFWAGRRRQRQRRRVRRFNPYVAGGPIFDERLFYGREPLVQKILQTVHNNSLLLHGERRIGKTSLLHQVERRLAALDDPTYRFLPVYIDLQGTREEKFFATLADPIFEAFAALAGLGERVPALARDAPYGSHDFVRELHELLKCLTAGTEKRVKLVLLIDEVDELNDYDPRVSQSLRSLFMKRFGENLAAVVAGVHIRREWDRESSPWYNFFEEIEVDALSPEAAGRLVEEPLRGTFRFAHGAVRRIVETTGGKPFLIQRRCLALVQRLHEAGRRTITLADVLALEREDSP